MMTADASDDKVPLKPCPFCGGKPKFVQDPRYVPPWGWIECNRCGARTDDVKEQTAHEYWNRRFDGDAYVEVHDTRARDNS